MENAKIKLKRCLKIYKLLQRKEEEGEENLKFKHSREKLYRMKCRNSKRIDIINIEKKM